MSSASQGEGWWQASDGNWYPPETAAGAAGQQAPGPAAYPGPAPSGPAPGIYLPALPCPRCGQPSATDRVSCEYCEQVKTLPVGVTMTTPGRRLGQYALDLGLAIITAFIGWFIWSLVIWRSGETPAMQIMRIKVVKLDTGEVAPWGTMFLREFVGKWIVMGLISSIFFPAWVVLVFMLMWDKNRQELWDKIASTIVVSNYPEPVEVGDPYLASAEQVPSPVPMGQAPAPVAAEQPPQA